MLKKEVRNTPPAGETELIARAKNRDSLAIKALIQQHNRRVYRIARSIVGNDSEAEDVVQEAYVRAFTNLDAFRGESNFRTWLSRIVLNEAFGRLRRRRPTVDWADYEQQPAMQAQIIAFPLTNTQLDPECTMAQREIQAMLEKLIDELPEAFRIVLVTRLIEGMSVEETADLLHLHPATVKTRLHRARRLLKDGLEKQIGPVLSDAFPFDGQRCVRMADKVLARLQLSN